MEYKESDRLMEEDDADDSSEAEVSPNILDMEADEELDTSWSELDLDIQKKPNAPVRFSLEKRRRIEEIQEERRLNKEFGYDVEVQSLEGHVVKKGE